ncbi:hypothetical protein [Flavisphingomonas formosensis]|nr:hypothetical protein [Sphingomonas formosensis]
MPTRHVHPAQFGSLDEAIKLAAAPNMEAGAYAATVMEDVPHS